MATLVDVTDRDSGVASSEATPEGQSISPGTGELEEEQVEQASSAAAGDTLALLADDDDQDDEDVDESMMERILGLTEMFPPRLRSMSVNAVSSTLSLAKGAYELTRQVVWVAVSSSVVLFAPVMFELERLNVEEMMKQDRNRLVLGPGSAMSGTGAAPPGLMPPPPTR